MPDTENPQFSLKETKFYSVYLFIYAFNYSEKYNIWDWVTTFLLYKSCNNFYNRSLLILHLKLCLINCNDINLMKYVIYFYILYI